MREGRKMSGRGRKGRTSTANVKRRYFHPIFCDWSHFSSVDMQEFLGITRRPTIAESTAPNEKNTDRAVTRYCLDLGMCSRRRVPSVGIDPWNAVSQSREHFNEYGHGYTPTELPRRKSAMQSVTNELDSEAKMPKMAVRKSVALNAVIRPIKSEPMDGVESGKGQQSQRR
jgi:hypothetical protein